MVAMIIIALVMAVGMGTTEMVVDMGTTATAAGMDTVVMAAAIIALETVAVDSRALADCFRR
jgi:cellobiose-specific phosphotransferase system component IIB